MIEGTCDVRFARVRDAFRSNFTQHAEIGAAVAVYVAGRLVVNLWGGHCDPARTRAWHQHTLVDVFSVGKGIATLIVLDAVTRGELALDAAIARYWPEFGTAGKGGITLRHVLAHRAGLPAIREPLPAGAGLDPLRMARALEQQEPWWQPGEAHGYHVNTFGLHASACGVARVYAGLIEGDLLPASLLHDATREHAQGIDRVLDRPSRFGLGFQLTQPERPLGPNAGAFGHFGAGGSLGFCDPEAGIGFGYVMNDMGSRWQNPRNRALIDSLYASL
ncbi:MAG TPA: serine hydrolase domain-containing protein [Polyangiales bacterium]|nr:serine hydrolase domain-containing protein [Polyangiales bacterium]